MKLKEEPGFYFSEDDREFDPADLIESVVSIDQNNVETPIDLSEINFKGATPKSTYAETETYFEGTVTAYYGTGEDAIPVAEPTVYIGVKGDADLNGKVELSDATLTLTYYCEHSVNNPFYFTTSSSTEPERIVLEKLAYFLADINTESKAGTDTDTSSVELSDATSILTFYCEDSVNNNPKWAEVCKELADHPIWGKQLTTE